MYGIFVKTFIRSLPLFFISHLYTWNAINGDAVKFCVCVLWIWIQSEILNTSLFSYLIAQFYNLIGSL